MLDDIDNLLDDAINAHEAKDFNAAAIKYTKILEQDAHHADANHNFGLLTIELGFKDEALIFLQTAINTNPNVLQYWVTCLDTLINIERFYDAQSVLEKAYLFGYTDEVFEHLRHNLDLKQQQCGTLVKLNQVGAVKTDFDQATLEICEDGDGDASNVQSDGGVISSDKVSKQEEPPIEQIQSLMELLSQQRFTQVYERAERLTKQYSNNLTIWNIMGSAAAQNGQLDQAAFAFEKAINIKPNATDAHNNLGNVLIEQGKLNDAIEAYKKAISFKQNYPEALENLLGLTIQLRGTSLHLKIKKDHSSDINLSFIDRPMYHIHQALRAFLLADPKLVCTHLNGYISCTPSSIAKLSPKDQVFCSAYKHFLQKLIEVPFENEPSFADDQNVFHLGESHCLSYAHRRIKIHGIDYIIAPRITFGGKAYHFSRKKEDGIKAITKANFDSLPDGSKVFLSFGEIDCRPNEGFISAASKLNRPIESIISDTVDGYVDWFAEQNQIKNHSLFFFNVPAPCYDKKYTGEVNEKVKTTLELFNNLLNKSILNHNFKIIDVYKFTVGHDGFSNGSFHIDNRHLSRDAIPEIEKQICS